MQSAVSLILAFMVAAAMIAANGPFSDMYALLHSPTATLVINDGLMALFFLVIGIELKLEIREGELSTVKKALLPVAGALGGVAVPALIYAGFNHGSDAMRGWAVPMATDIAFALGLVGFFGTRIPPSLRIFLMALAVIDDLMAIVVIAVFYTAELSLQALAMTAGILALLYAYNRMVTRMTPFLLAGAALWIAMHASGIHATLSGVLLGLLLPMKMGHRLFERLHPPVMFLITPLFVFANAGVPLEGLTLERLLHPVSAGIALGLFLGKQCGIFGVSWLMVRAGLAPRPAGASWGQFYGICLAAGIGFTMSLFIGTLAFGPSPLMTETRLGVLLGSLASALCGAILLAVTLPKGTGKP